MLDDENKNLEKSKHSSDNLIQKPILSNEERLVKVNGSIEAFESGELELDFDDKISSDDPPVAQYLKANRIIDGIGSETKQARHALIDKLSQYERIIQGMVNATPEQITHAVQDYYNIFSQLRKLGMIKGTFFNSNLKETIDRIENRQNTFEDKLDKLQQFLEKLQKDLGL